jgi:RNA polymerase subunit RPABC4/transcription elongation factor Spt4
MAGDRMKKCKICKAVFDDEAEICSICGSSEFEEVV